MMDRPTSKSSASETHGVSPLAIVHPTPENPTNQMSPISVRSSRNSQSCTSDDSEISKLVLASTPSPFKELGYGHYLAALEQARSKITYFASNVESCIIATPELVRKMQVRRPGDPMAFTGLPASSTEGAENELVTPPSMQQAAQFQPPPACPSTLQQSITRRQPMSAPPTRSQPTVQFQPTLLFHPPVVPMRHIQPMSTSPEPCPLLERAPRIQYMSTKSAHEHTFFTHHSHSPPLTSAQLSIPSTHMADSTAHCSLPLRTSVSSRWSAPSTFIPLAHCAPADMQLHWGRKAQATAMQERVFSPPPKRAAMQFCSPPSPSMKTSPLFKEALSPLDFKCRFSSTISPLKPIRLVFSP
eukprot:GEMP01029533.1.p1 GENE.GEMP01029533.1~~GEMP01029533.1.p1  ORF type:complete len:357 (+),score=46.85 GEMP01029533.1:88-1158(+)